MNIKEVIAKRVQYSLIVCLSLVVSESAADRKWQNKDHLEFVTEPTSQLVSADGGRAVFKCVVSPNNADIRWLHNGSPVYQSASSGLKISRNKLVLKLPKSSRNSTSGHVVASGDSSNLSNLFHGGGFQCLAQHKSHSIVSQTAKLILAELKPFAHKDNVSVEAIAGNTAVIPCAPPHSVPNAVTEFAFNDTVIDRTRDRYHLMPSGDLQIYNVRESDSGTYRCIAHNPFLGERTFARHFVELRVVRDRNRHHHHHNSPSGSHHPHHRNSHSHVLPKFVVTPKTHISSVMGANVTFECAAMGSPVPSITWKKLEGQLPKNRYYLDGGNLILSNVRRGDDGTYVCTAANGSPNSAITANSVLDIQEIPQIVGKTQIEEKDVVEGQEIALECSTKGKPKPIVDWFHNGIQITPEVANKHGINIKGADGSKLSIMNSKSELHSGMYQCFATNELKSTYATMIVNVIGSEQSEANPTPKKNHKSESDEEETEPTDTIDEGDPGDEEEDLFNQLPNQNRKKNKNKGIKMIPPTKPEVTRLSEESVMVRWDVPQNDGLPIMFFKVQYREMGTKGSDWNTVDDDIPPHIHSYAVNGLKANSKYRFRIAAVYSNNDNKLSPNSNKFTLLKEPPMKKPINGPVITNSEPVSPSAITMKWEYLNIDSVTIDGFFIYYRASIYAGDYLKVASMGAYTRSHIITHLLPDTTYEIKMQCFNEAGTSEFSNIFMVKTLPSPNTTKDKDNKKDNNEDNNINGDLNPVVKSDHDRTLYSVIFITGGALILVFVVCIVLCCVRSKQQTPRANGSLGKLPKEKHPKANSNHNHNHIFSHSNQNLFTHHRSNGHLSNTLVAAASNGYLSRSTINGIDRGIDTEYPHHVNIRVNPFHELSNGGSTLGRSRSNSINESFRSKSASQHHLSHNNTNNNINETPLSMDTMERRKMKRMDESYPTSGLHHSNSRLNHHSSSRTRLNGTLERKRRSRTDLLNASDKDNTDSEVTQRQPMPLSKCNGVHSSAATNGTLVIMQSSC